MESDWVAVEEDLVFFGVSSFVFFDWNGLPERSSGLPQFESVTDSASSLLKYGRSTLTLESFGRKIDFSRLKHLNMKIPGGIEDEWPFTDRDFV